MHLPDPEMARRLRLARAKKGIERKDAAEALRVPYPTYASHENGTRAFVSHVARYARFYGVRRDWLQYGLGSMRPGHRDELQEIAEHLDSAGLREWKDYGRYLGSKKPQ